VAEVQEEMGDGFRIFRGQEVDILKDGSLDQPEEILEGLDLVVASVHSFMDQDGPTMTARVLRAVTSGYVHILGHPTGRLLGRREPYDLDVEAVLEAAKEHGVAVELNAHPRRLDLNDHYLRRARELGVPVVINTDAHSVQGLDVLSYGLDQARRGWLEPENVLNCGSTGEIEQWLSR
jgi:DNA polymerase (family 10)